jgi:hypothetical protein
VVGGDLRRNVEHMDETARRVEKDGAGDIGRFGHGDEV